MQRALYEPGLGYYAVAYAATDAPGRLPDRARAAPDLRSGGRPANSKRCGNVLVSRRTSWCASTAPVVDARRGDGRAIRVRAGRGGRATGRRNRSSAWSWPMSSSTRCRFTALPSSVAGCKRSSSAGRTVISSRSWARCRTLRLAEWFERRSIKLGRGPARRSQPGHARLAQRGRGDARHAAMC